MIGDDNSCQETVGTKSDEHRACEKTKPHEDEVVENIRKSDEHEVVVNAVKVMEKSDEHEVAVHVKKTFFPKKKFNRHLVL